MLDDADRQTEEAVERRHPFRVALGEIIVDRDDVDAFAFERVQVDGQRRDERLAFARAHLGDFAFVKHHAADELHVEMTHAQSALAGFARDGEGFDEQIFERLALSDPLAELGGLRGERFVAEGLHRWFELIDARHDAAQARDFAVVAVDPRLESAEQG